MKIRGVLALSLLAAPSFAQEKEKGDTLAGNHGIANYYRVRPDVSTAGQPSDEALADIQKAGFKSVISLRTEQEGSLEEKPKVEALGLEYHNIPIEPRSEVEYLGCASTRRASCHGKQDG